MSLQKYKMPSLKDKHQAQGQQKDEDTEVKGAKGVKRAYKKKK